MSVLDAAQRETLRKALEAYEGGRLDFEGFVEEVEWL